MLVQVKQDLKQKLPAEVVDALFECYQHLVINYSHGRHEPSELNGGKFVEAAIRIIEFLAGGTYTSLDTDIKDAIGQLRNFERLPVSVLDEPMRIHLPRVLITMYNIRSKRGVAHLRGEINPNYSDASLLVACASWVMAELFRVHYRCSLDEAQQIVDTLVQRPLALVHEFGTQKRVLLPELTHRDQTLLLLASEHPKKVTEAELVEWIEPVDVSGYRRKVLRPLHQERMIEHRPSEYCFILPTGVRYVEDHYSGWLERLN
jgi:hypothetical protein